MHRSQQDPKYYEEGASRYVLVSTRARLPAFLHGFVGADGAGGGTGAADDDAESRTGDFAGWGDEGEDDGEGGDLPDDDFDAAFGRGASARAAVGDGDSGDNGGDSFTEAMYAGSDINVAGGVIGGSGGAGIGSRQRPRPRHASARGYAVRVVDVLTGEAPTAGAGGGSGAKAAIEPPPSRVAVAEIREVDDLGLPLDGYNYNRHLAPIDGSGVLIGVAPTARVVGASAGAVPLALPRRAGSVRGGGSVRGSVASGAGAGRARVVLPTDVLPTDASEELERGEMLEAIVMSDASLPADLREVMALLDAEDDEADGSGGDNDAAAAEAAAGNAAAAGAGVAGGLITGDAVPRRRIRGRSLDELDDEFILHATGQKSYARDAGAEEENDGVSNGVSGGVSGGARGGAGGADGSFDFDAHIARLMARAEGKVTDTADDFDEEEEDDDDDNGTGGGVGGGGGPAPQRAGDDLLAAMLESAYQDDDIGELDADDPRLSGRGRRTRAPPGRGRLAAAAAAAPASATADVNDEDDEGSDDDRFHRDDNDIGEQEEEEDFEDEEDVDGDDMAGEMFHPSDAALSGLLDAFIEERESGRVYGGTSAGGRRKGSSIASRAHSAAAAAAAAASAASAKASVAAAAAAASTAGKVPAVPIVHVDSAPAPAPATASASTAAFTVRLGGLVLSAPPAAASMATAAVPALQAAEAASRAGDDDSDGDVFVPFGCADGDFAEVDDAAAEAAFVAEAERHLLRPPRARGDAATAVSGYTNTEHHPKTLGDGVSITSARRRTTVPLPSAPTAAGGSLPLLLSRKTGLPVASRLPLPEAPKLAPVAIDASDEHVGDDHVSAASGSRSEDDEEALAAASAGGARPADETSEQRRARKAAVRADRRERRAGKKALKTAFKDEGKRMRSQAQAARAGEGTPVGARVAPIL